MAVAWRADNHRWCDPDATVKLVLFDIDGTLLWTDGAGRRAITTALLEVFGCAGPMDHRFDGKTDPQIVHEMMQIAGFDGVEIDRRLPALMELYFAELDRELGAADESLHVFDGVIELLDALDDRTDIVLGLLTGNLRRGAELKLDRSGIGFERFRIGAFGCDNMSRPELPAIAQRRAREELGLHLRGRDIVVIGDTPADLQCGSGIGALAIGVATGRYDADELRAHGPIAVFGSLRDTKAVIRAIVASPDDSGGQAS